MSIYQPLQLIAIDDDPHMREMIQDFVSSRFSDAQLTCYSSGEEALQSIFKKPDLIILDYHLDSSDPMAMNGMQLLNKIKERFSDAAIVFLSAQESTDIAANTIKFGAFDYIVKNNMAFQRLELVIRNLRGQSALKKSAGTQRFFNYLLLGLVGALVAGILWMRMAG